MESRNPVFNSKTLSKVGIQESEKAQLMTIHGTINKIGILLALTAASSIFAWNVADSSTGAILAIGSIS